MENESIKSLLKEIITQESINSLVRDAVQEKVEAIFQYEQERVIKKLFDETIKNTSEKYMQEIVEKVLSGAVRTDDGWGNVETKGSFSDLVRTRIKKNIDSQWNFTESVRREVDKRIKSFCEEVKKGRVEDMTEEVLKRISKEYADAEVKL